MATYVLNTTPHSVTSFTFTVIFYRVGATFPPVQTITVKIMIVEN